LSKGKYLYRKQAVVFFSLGIMFLPLSSFAQEEPAFRDEEIEKTFSKMESDMNSISEASEKTLREDGSVKPASAANIIIPSKKIQQETAIQTSRVSVAQSSREQSMEITLRNIAIEISLEYFMNMGRQTWNALNPDTGGDMSRLEFPLEGGMPIVKGEARFLPRVSLGGRYADSQLKQKVCSDEDWNFWSDSAGEYIDYQITKQGSQPRVQFYDINLYYNLFSSGQDSPDRRTIFPADDPVYENLLVDKISLDLLAGYQYYKGRYHMIDPMQEAHGFDDGFEWYDPTLPKDIGLDSYYKIKYWGPRIGFRASGSKGKVTSQIKFAYALLRTKAYGWWNLREYSFWQSGSNGYGLDLGIDTTYAFTPSFSAGVGFNYLSYYQNKMRASGINPTGSYSDLDIIRDADCRNFGPTFILKYTW
jgi:hypothetical protein